MAKEELRIGLIGFGAMGKTHAYAVQNLPYFCGELPFHASVVGLATRDISRAKSLADTYGIPAAMTEQEMLSCPDIDIIDICTPNIAHAATARAALAAGKHLYCEKPLCDNLGDALELADLAKRSGKICTAVFNNRHLAPVLRAKQLIEEGRLGRILHFDFQYLHNSCTDPERIAGWKQNADICGRGGVLFDLGSHVLDLAVLLCGKMKIIYGKSQIAFPARKGMDGGAWQTNSPEAFYMTLTAESGAMGTVTASKLTTGVNDDLTFAVYGEKGAVRFSLMEPNYLWFYDGTAAGEPIGGLRGFTRIECVGRYPAPAGAFPSPKASVGWLRGHVMSMYHFLNAVYEGKQNAPDFTDAAYIQYLMELALESDAKGCEVEVKS